MRTIIRQGNGAFNPNLLSLLFSMCDDQTVKSYMASLSRTEAEAEYKRITRELKRQMVEGKITKEPADYCYILALEAKLGRRDSVLPRLFLAELATVILYGPQTMFQQFLADWVAKFDILASLKLHEQKVRVTTGLKVEKKR